MFPHFIDLELHAENCCRPGFFPCSESDTDQKDTPNGYKQNITLCNANQHQTGKIKMRFHPNLLQANKSIQYEEQSCNLNGVTSAAFNPQEMLWSGLYK